MNKSSSWDMGHGTEGTRDMEHVGPGTWDQGGPGTWDQGGPGLKKK